MLDIYKIKHDEKYYIFLLQPYVQFNEPPKDTARIDAYYLASNSVFLQAKNLINELKAQNIFAKIEQKFIYKKTLISHSGDFVFGKNTLLIHKRYGSRFALACIELQGDNFDKSEFISHETEVKTCSGCSKCLTVCPENAITEDGFSREKCLRHQMDFEFEDGKKFANRLIGCDDCQNICPYNSERRTEYPQELQEKLKYDYLITCIDDKKNLEFLEKYIGKNFVRKERLARLIKNGNDNILK